MARQNQNPGLNAANVNNAQAAQAAALDDDAETPAPEVLAKPEVSPAERIAALQAEINALTAANSLPHEIDPGSTVRPTEGMRHLTLGTPIFNAGRPTGRAG